MPVRRPNSINQPEGKGLNPTEVTHDPADELKSLIKEKEILISNLSMLYTAGTQKLRELEHELTKYR